ncbi:unnamed protein product [Aphis gossypii]|uniref:BACK domain-containing protein n=1 Tax=Aphis gossypii TaxID=80765 RepID=A0A9P0JHY8_APHGO|nr:unnamed protein product [Aphis gossypii]
MLQILSLKVSRVVVVDYLMPAAVAADDAHSEAFARMVQHYDTLLAYCGAFIDRNADRVMTDESVDELDTVELRELLRRDGLAVSNEMVLFATVERWCTHKCKQQHLELTVANRRAVLDDTVLLSVRYLQMTANEFLSGPMPSGLLNAQETAVLMKHILNPKQPKWTCQRLTKETLEYMATARAKRSHGTAGAGGGTAVVVVQGRRRGRSAPLRRRRRRRRQQSVVRVRKFAKTVVVLLYGRQKEQEERRQEEQEKVCGQLFLQLSDLLFGRVFRLNAAALFLPPNFHLTITHTHTHTHLMVREQT